MQRILLSLSLLASAAVGVLASDDLKIEVTLPVECERKTHKGDSINVHYRGTLQSNGEKFDASEAALAPPPLQSGRRTEADLYYQSQAMTAARRLPSSWELGW